MSLDERTISEACITVIALKRHSGLLPCYVAGLKLLSQAGHFAPQSKGLYTLLRDVCYDNTFMIGVPLFVVYRPFVPTLSVRFI